MRIEQKRAGISLFGREDAGAEGEEWVVCGGRKGVDSAGAVEGAGGEGEQLAAGGCMRDEEPVCGRAPAVRCGAPSPSTPIGPRGVVSASR